MNLICKSILRAAVAGILIHILTFLLLFFTLYIDGELLLRFLSSLFVSLPIASIAGIVYFFCASPNEVIYGNNPTMGNLDDPISTVRSFSPLQPHLPPLPTAPPEDLV